MRIWCIHNISPTTVGYVYKPIHGRLVSFSWFICSISQRWTCRRSSTWVEPIWSKDLKDPSDDLFASCYDMGMGQHLVPLVNIKIAGKWMFIPLQVVVLIGIDPWPYVSNTQMKQPTPPNESLTTWTNRTGLLNGKRLSHLDRLSGALR